MWKKFSMIEDSLSTYGINFFYKLNPQLHDREVRLSNGWTIKIGRGFDIYQKTDGWFQIGVSDFELRPCPGDDRGHLQAATVSAST